MDQAISKLEKMGCKVYPHGEMYSVWFPHCKNLDQSCRYTARQLVKLAAVSRSRKSGKSIGKAHIGTGGPFCPCCAPPPQVTKVLTKRHLRRLRIDDEETS